MTDDEKIAVLLSTYTLGDLFRLMEEGEEEEVLRFLLSRNLIKLEDFFYEEEGCLDD
tara:strand:+ start:9378 stop:9548 length:171 start_codon:yes stop_codon:yes gene_type:complete